MSTPTPDPTDPLAAPLRSAAVAVTPAFSHSLHTDVMRRVRQHRVTPRHRPTVARWAVAAVAATVTIGTGIWTMRPRAGQPEPVRQTTVAIVLPPMPSLSAAVRTVSDPIARQLSDARLDLVDHSAGRFARYCVEQLDVFPMPSPSAAPTTNAAGDVDRG